MTLHFAGMFNVAAVPEVMVRTAAVYAFMLVGLRLAGKRQLGQMTLFDLVVILIIANSVQNAMVGPDTSLIGGMTAATTLLVLNYGVSWLRCRYRPISRWLGGLPTSIIVDGRFLTENMRREHLAEDEVLMAIREHGVERLEDVHRATLETDGSISVVPLPDVQMRPKRRVRFLKKTS